MAADEHPPKTREIGVGESWVLSEHQVRRGHAHHRRDATAFDEVEYSFGFERRFEHDRCPLPPGEKGLHVPAADVKLRQHLQDDVVAAHRRGEVETDVRPEAVRVCQHHAFWCARRSRRRDNEQSVVVVDVR